MKFFAPASIGNFSVGFDLLGLAIKPVDNISFGDIVEITASKKHQLKMVGNYAQDLPDRKENLVYKAINLFIKTNELESQIDTFSVTLKKDLPLGSGLGSSAASIVATLTALNHYFQLPLDISEILKLAGQLEGNISGTIHYDNVAPTLLGGLQLITPCLKIPSRSIPIPSDWCIVIAYPGASINTVDARKLLPKNIPLSTSIQYAQNLSAFIDAMHRDMPDQAIDYLFDVIAEPYRINNIPGFSSFRDFAKTVGAIGTGISGSGPSVFALCHDMETANRIKEYAQNHFCQKKGFAHICLPDFIGCRMINAD